MINKLFLISFSCFLFACVKDAEEDKNKEENYSVMRDVIETYKNKEPTEQTEFNCEFVDYYVNNCFVQQKFCNKKLISTKVECENEKQVFLWETLPDPPHQVSPSK